MIYRVTKCLLIETHWGQGTVGNPCRIIRNYVDPKSGRVIDKIDDFVPPPAEDPLSDLPAYRVEWADSLKAAAPPAPEPPGPIEAPPMNIPEDVPLVDAPGADPLPW